MKKIIIITIYTFLFGGCSFAQEKETIVKPNYLEGITTKDAFKKAPYKLWFNNYYDNYTLDKTTLDAIRKNLKGVTIKAFMGTWCGDSKREIPHLYKLLDATDFEEKNMVMIAVNRGKKTADNLQEGLNIFRVPTLIFYKNDKEIGRYVEYARETLEKDILKIITERPYKHSYDNN